MNALISFERTGTLLHTFVSFHGIIFGGDNREIASIEYVDSEEGGRLVIHMGRDSIEVSSSRRFLMGTAGNIVLNGEVYGRYDFSNLLQPLILRDKSGKIIMTVEDDSADRRFLWAYRNGASRQEALDYARAEYALLTGAEYALASIVGPLHEPFYPATEARYSIMNAADEEVFLQKRRAEQLSILVCACWWLCDAMHPAKSKLRDGWEYAKRVSIPSFSIIQNRVVMSPHLLAPRNRQVELRHTQPILMWVWLACSLLLSLLILPACQGEFSADHVCVLIYSSIIPSIWILVCWWMNENARKRLICTERRLNNEAAGT